jgi:hypothetical protein
VCGQRLEFGSKVPEILQLAPQRLALQARGAGSRHYNHFPISVYDITISYTNLVKLGGGEGLEQHMDKYTSAKKSKAMLLLLRDISTGIADPILVASCLLQMYITALLASPP